MRELVDHENKVLAGEVLPKVRVPLEEQLNFIQREDNLEQPEILHEQDKGLES